MKAWMAVLVVALLATVSLAEDGSVSLLTDQSTSKLEGRLGVSLDETWEVGGLATWWAEDPGTDWSAGAYLKLAVDPNGSVPVANWLPGLGDWLSLPESIAAETYIIGKGEVVPLDEGPQIAVSGGAGAQAGPFVVEWIYRLVEEGESDNPVISSGAELWFGGRIEF